MKRVGIGFLLIMIFITLVACDKKEKQVSENKERIGPSDLTVNDEVKLFESDAALEFTFASGAGAWRTQLTLNPDGTFEGIFRDSEMGDWTEEYSRGTAYICEFSGKFGDIKQINEYTYSIYLDTIDLRYQVDETWIEDDIRYIASDPYGLDVGKEFLFYTPETPIDGLNEEFLYWWPLYSEQEEQPREKLMCYGILNKEMNYGFFTYSSLIN